MKQVILSVESQTLMPETDSEYNFASMGGNYEFLSTLTINALVFNNVFYNIMNILDVNFGAGLEHKETKT